MGPPLRGWAGAAHQQDQEGTCCPLLLAAGDSSALAELRMELGVAWFECLPLPKLMAPKSKGQANERENKSVWECAERMFPFIATVEGLSQSYHKDGSVIYCFCCFFLGSI